MAERNDLLLFGFALEYDFKEKDRAREVYEKYIFTHDFFVTYATIVGHEKAEQEVRNALKSEPIIYAVNKFDSYLTILLELYRYYGKDNFVKTIGKFKIKFANYDDFVLLRKKIMQ